VLELADELMKESMVFGVNSNIVRTCLLSLFSTIDMRFMSIPSFAILVKESLRRVGNLTKYSEGMDEM
jgi:hypothetical protein